MKRKLLHMEHEGMPSHAIRYTLYAIRPSRGLTLIETLLYTAIVAIVITAFMLSTYGLLQTSERVAAGIELADAKLFMMQKLEWLMQGVDTITAPPSAGSGQTLSLTKVNFAENPLTVDAGGGALRLSS
ncbi:MAG: hypothetical protein HYW56_01930, partial [Candidatus Harrisonbacteria bacterium]|nr:hypothetical protein [Candidatus Harrisonbacteria bacterium]